MLIVQIDSNDESMITLVFKHVTISSNNSTNTVADFVIEKNQ